jgi:hypothetical protein
MASRLKLNQSQKQRLHAVAVALNFLKPRDRGLWKGDANALVRFRDSQYV